MSKFDALLHGIPMPNASGRPVVGAPMPALPMCDEHGNALDVREACSRGPVVLLFFRGFWCKVCNAQFATLDGTIDVLRAQQGDLWAVSVDAPDVIAYQRARRPDLRMTFASVQPQALATIGLRYESAEKVLAVPSCIVLDRRARVRWTHYATRNGDRAPSAELLEQVRTVLQSP